mmetsp:Transcript_120237/g.335454  ORF Transcript_120237/g.335454 Transcript_120237/m.335454 type:complete len:82 (+) Transcript_120237:676-921(+)
MILSALQTVQSRCAITMAVRFLVAKSSSRASCTVASDSASRAEVASSRIMMDGSRRRALAIAMRCFWPPESCMPFSPTCVS